MGGRLVIRAGALWTPRSRYAPATVRVRGERIEEVLLGPWPELEPGDTLIAAEDWILAPGFIDLHVHGGGGFDTMDAELAALAGLAAFHARHGTTALLPSTVAAPQEQIHRALEAIGEAMGAPHGGAEILGAHVEGPFLSLAKRGGHLAGYVRPFDRNHDAWLFAHPGAIRRVTLAPELPGALDLIRELRSRGVLVSIGHSAAGEALVAQAALAGATLVTHLFNAMSTMEKVGPLRRLGLAEAALVCGDLSVEVIADGLHVPLSLLPLIVRTKGASHTALVTDCMRAAGLPDGRYLLGAEDSMGATVRQGMAVTDEGGLAGSVATLDQMLRNLVQSVGLPLGEALQMVTLTPAQILGIADHQGEVSIGKRANLVLLDQALQVKMTIVAGQVVYPLLGTGECKD